MPLVGGGGGGGGIRPFLFVERTAVFSCMTSKLLALESLLFEDRPLAGLWNMWLSSRETDLENRRLSDIPFRSPRAGLKRRPAVVLIALF